MPLCLKHRAVCIEYSTLCVYFQADLMEVIVDNQIETCLTGQSNSTARAVSRSY